MTIAVCLFAPSVVAAATISAGPDGIVYEGGADLNRVLIQPADDGDLLFKERSEDVAITNLVPTCTVTTEPNQSRVRCEDPGAVFTVDAGARLDFVLTSPKRNTCGITGFTLAVDGGSSRDLIVGGADSKDLLVGGLGEDRIDGCGRDDVILGQNGDDKLFGGNQDDQIEGNNGDDAIEAGPGEDEVEAGVGSDYVDGGEDKDEIEGEQGVDRLFGGRKYDQLDGGEGPDVLWGGEELDDLSGGLGDDRLFGGTGSDRVWGREGDDLVVGCDRVDGSGPDDAQGDYLNGGVGDDRLIGCEGDDDFKGKSGMDMVDGVSGDEPGDGPLDIQWLNCGSDLDRYAAFAVDHVEDCEEELPPA
jgi:Ca2+-binding RTX toxin-like protein